MKLETEFKPLFDNVVVKVNKKEASLTTSGLFIPDNATRGKFRTGKVVAVGPGKLLRSGTFHPTTVKVGDTVVFNEFMGTNWNGYLFTKEPDLWCIVEGTVVERLDDMEKYGY